MNFIVRPDNHPINSSLEPDSPDPEPNKNKSSTNRPEGIQKQKIFEEIKCITEDVSRMPEGSEKITLDLLKNFLQSKLNGVANLPSEEAIENTYENLGNQLKNQYPNSQSIKQILIDLKSKTNISDIIICLRKLLKEIRPLNIREIVRPVTKAPEGNSLISGQGIVLFIGETGRGKSTTIQLLAGCKMAEFIRNA